MVRQVIKEEWNSYSRQVMPKDAPSVQRSECMMAFYAGVASVMHKMRELADVPDEQAMEYLEAMDNEIHTFYLQMKAKAGV